MQAKAMFQMWIHFWRKAIINWLLGWLQIYGFLDVNYIEDIQWFDVEYGIYFTSRTGFYFNIFKSAKHEWNMKKILSHKWNEIHIQRQKHWLSSLLYFHWFWACFFQILDTAHNTWCDVIITCYFYIVKIKLLIFSQCEITTFEDITFIQWIKLDIMRWKCNNTLHFALVKVHVLGIKP